MRRWIETGNGRGAEDKVENCWRANRYFSRGLVE